MHIEELGFCKGQFTSFSVEQNWSEHRAVLTQAGVCAKHVLVMFFAAPVAFIGAPSSSSVTPQKAERALMAPIEQPLVVKARLELEQAGEPAEDVNEDGSEPDAGEGPPKPGVSEDAASVAAAAAEEDGFKPDPPKQESSRTVLNLKFFARKIAIFFDMSSICLGAANRLGCLLFWGCLRKMQHPPACSSASHQRQW